MVVPSRVEGARTSQKKRWAEKRDTDKGRKYKSQGKDIQLEDLYLVELHPLWANTPGGCTFIYYADTTRAGCKKTWDQEKDLVVPLAPYEVIIKWGIVSALSDMNRTRSRPVPELDSQQQPTGKMTGGTAYERSPFAVSVKPPARAYTIGRSIEAPTSIMAPVASGKVKPGDDVVQLEARSKLLELIPHQIAMAGAMASACKGPEYIQELLQERSSFTNKPRTVTDDNWAYATLQNRRPCSRLRAHIDNKDDCGYTTHMGFCHDIPRYYKPGMFFILQLGVFVLLEQYTGINFYGLWKHGGTPPLCPIGRELHRWAYRFVMISYPPKHMVNGTARFSLGALPNNELLLIAPEMVNADCEARADWSPTPTTGRLTWMNEGLPMMAVLVLLAFVLPQEWEIQFDPDLMTQAIMFRDSEGRRRNTGRWSLAPGIDALRRWWWDEYQAKVAMHVPYVGRKGRVTHSLPMPMPKKDEKKKEEVAEREFGSESESDSDENDPTKKKPARRGKGKGKGEDKGEKDTGISDDESEVDSKRELVSAARRPIGKQVYVFIETSPTKRKADESPTHDQADSVSLSDRALGKRRAVEEPVLNGPTPIAVERQLNLISRWSTRFELQSQSLTHGADDPDVIMEEAGQHLVQPRRSGTSFISQLTLDTIEANLIDVDVKVLASDEAMNSLQGRLHRSAVISTNYLAWRWLNGVCVGEIKKALEVPTPISDEQSWIRALARDVQCLIDNHTKHAILLPESYGLKIAASLYTYHCSKPIYALSTAEMFARVLPVTTNIIASSLSYSVTTLARQQAWFLHPLVKLIGHVLLLEDVWKAYINLCKDVIGTAKRKEELLAIFQAFEDGLQQTPLARPDSEEHIMLKKMAILVCSACNGTLPYRSISESFEYGAAETPPPDDVEMGSPWRAGMLDNVRHTSQCDAVMQTRPRLCSE
ncbi:hypothetical protein C8R43DRAFT_947994 [Mycena crocata]|nr:hypothetical protein C8R43DRAFT_947994 [Mycena crocata]